MQKLLTNNLIWILLLAVLVISAGIILAGNQKQKKLTIELGQTFQKDLVKIYLDKKLVYNKELTTPEAARITDVVTVSKPNKPFAVTVEVNGAKFEKSSPKQQKEMDKEDYSLLIDYDRAAEEVDIKTKIVIVLYD